VAGGSFHTKRHRPLTGYDATDLELALRESIPLATLDVEVKAGGKRSRGCGAARKSLNHDANMKTTTPRMKNGGQ
jgi:hypothetical protein